MKNILPVFLCFLFCLHRVSALVVPFGVQFDVPVNTVTGTWDWDVAYQGLYNERVAISTVFNGVEAGDYIMYAAKPVGATNFTMLAAAPEADVRTYTQLNTTRNANGVEWYYNGWSMGFARGGDGINQASADIVDRNTGTTGDFRLSWHTNAAHENSPTELDNGYRAGNNFLNASTTWERYVLVGTPVPELSTTVLFLIPFSMLGLGALLRRRKATSTHTRNR